MLEEIERLEPPPDDRPMGEPCPHCGTFTRYGQIGCPEGRLGCLVMHWGWHCDTCGRDFHQKIESDKGKE